jgi:hypothetical protein
VKTQTETFDLHQRPAGWFCPQTGRTYKTAVAASKAINRRGRRAVAGGLDAHAAVVNWHPVDRIGRLVVNAVTGN